MGSSASTSYYHVGEATSRHAARKPNESNRPDKRTTSLRNEKGDTPESHGVSAMATVSRSVHKGRGAGQRSSRGPRGVSQEEQALTAHEQGDAEDSLEPDDFSTVIHEGSRPPPLLPPIEGATVLSNSKLQKSLLPPVGRES